MAISQALNTALRGCVPDSAGATELIDMLDAIDVLGTAELAFIDGVTAAVAASSKALVLGASKEIGTISSASINAATLTNINVSAATITALNVGTGGAALTAGGNTEAISFASSGGSTASDAMQLPKARGVLLNVSSAGAYFKLPAPALGVAYNVINSGAASGILVAYTTTRSIANVSSIALAAQHAAGSGMDLVCDGTDWHKRVV